MVGTYIKKDTTVSTYDGKAYSRKSYLKRKDELTAKNQYCEYCDKYYTILNKFNHCRGKKHLAIIAYATKHNNTPVESGESVEQVEQVEQVESVESNLRILTI
jgi:hypothetical protein